MIQKYSGIFRNRIIQVGEEVQKLIDGDIEYSESLPYPEKARNRLYFKVLYMESQWRSDL